MIFHDYYIDVSPAEVDRFVLSQELGRLITVGADGVAHIGLYPFVYDGDAVELHLVRTDEQTADLEARSRCLFEVDEVLGVIPSYWVHPEYAGSATAYHRTVMLDCDAVISDDVAALAAQQRRLLARYQPEGGFRAVDPADPLYRGVLGQLAAVKLTVVRQRVKFKLGQNRPPEARRAIATELRRRGRPGDLRAADAIESTIGTAPTDGEQVSPR